MAKYRLAAHPFETKNGMVMTELFGTKAVAIVEAASFAELETKIAEFGTAHTPCNVWVTSQNKPKPRGFDKWNQGNGASKWLFEAPVTPLNQFGHPFGLCDDSSCDDCAFARRNAEIDA